MKRFLLVLLLVLAPATAAYAVNPDEVLKDPALEARARQISSQLRCLVCQNQSIDDSDAELAHDLRVIVRERLVAGDTDQQVMDYLVARYGEFVLLKPSFSTQNLLLWGTPALGLAFGLIAIVMLYRGRMRAAPADRLTDDEQARIAKILADGEDADQ